MIFRFCKEWLDVRGKKDAYYLTKNPYPRPAARTKSTQKYIEFYVHLKLVKEKDNDVIVELADVINFLGLRKTVSKGQSRKKPSKTAVAPDGQVISVQTDSLGGIYYIIVILSMYYQDAAGLVALMPRSRKPRR